FDMTRFGERDKARKQHDARMATHRRRGIIEVESVCRDAIEERRTLHRRLLSTAPQACQPAWSRALLFGQRRRKRFDVVACASHDRLVLRGNGHGHCVRQRPANLRDVVFAKFRRVETGGKRSNDLAGGSARTHVRTSSRRSASSSAAPSPRIVVKTSFVCWPSKGAGATGVAGASWIRKGGAL